MSGLPFYQYEPADPLTAHTAAQELLVCVQLLAEETQAPADAHRWAASLLASMEGRGLIKRVIREGT